MGDLGTIQTCKRIFKDQTSESGEIPFYKNGTIGLKADAFISREIFEEYKLLYPYPEKGDILISAVGSVGRTAEYTGEDEYFQDSNVVWLKTDNSIDKKYLKVFYQVIKWLIEGSTVKHLYNDNILKSEIVFPYSLDEQRKIGEYFDSLDHLITLHQWKHYRIKKIINSAWEQRKFSELYVRSSEKNDGSIGMDKNITVATMQFKEDVQVSTAEYLKTYYTFNLGDIAFEGHQSKEFRYGRFVENDIGNGIVSHIFAVFRPIQEYDLYFWKYAINNETLMQRILGRSTKASTMMHDLVANDFLNETFLVPSIDEQKQIGSLFNKLDHLITLHQRKCDETKKLKKYMLQKMFPQNGEKVPKIRFAGFSDDWEQRKVSELLYLSNEKNDGSYTRDDVLAASLGTELQKKHIYFGLRATDESVKNYKVVLPKDVIYTKSPIKGFPNGIIRTNKGETGIVPTLYCVYHSIDTINPSIIQAYFESKERLDAYLVPLVNIGARNNVNITDKEFINGSICIPKNETEQNRIVDLLEKISNLITLHQQKCDELQNIKKFMLKNMFA